MSSRRRPYGDRLVRGERRRRGKGTPVDPQPECRLVHARQTHASRLLLSAMVMVLYSTGSVMAQNAGHRELPAVREGAVTLVEAASVIRELSLVASEDSGTLTLRGEEGIFTLFDGSPDVLWQPRGEGVARQESLSGAVRQRGDGQWWLPVDVLAFLGLWVSDGVAEDANGRSFRLHFPPAPAVAGRDGELVDLGSGIPGLRMYAAGSAGPATQSLLLADAGLLGLAMPSHQERFDELVARSGRDRPLLLFVTAVEAGSWRASITFSQGTLDFAARHPFRLRLLDGEAAFVGPESPVVGVVLLPEEFDLRRPIRVQWGDASATVTFRR
ncbi:MAG: hypothetical protein WD273_07885 [Trueperaceae bacterium]